FVLDEAVGEYFMWAAADDVWDKSWIELLLPISINKQCIAFGFVSTIDSKGNQIFHSANNRKFSYTGSVLYRRFKYFCEPPFLGKANPIYGLFPRAKVLDQDYFVLQKFNQGSDVLFLFNLLKKTEIEGGSYVFLKKRIHDHCSSISPLSAEKLAFSTKIVTFFSGLVRMNLINLRDFGKLSSFNEKIIQSLITPLILTIEIFYLSYLQLKKLWQSEISSTNYKS
ncbi:MAG: hypothetical protein ACO4CG_12975, partial [Prochlorothrix sp.]